jgi:hypothetical protein
MASKVPLPPAVAAALAALSAGTPGDLEVAADALVVRGSPLHVVATRALPAGTLLRADHALPATTKAALGASQLAACGVDDDVDAFWAGARAAGAAPGGDTLWCLEAEPVRAMRHASSSSPAVRVYTAAAASVVHVLRALAAGDEVLRDHFEPAGVASVSRAAQALGLLPPDAWTRGDQRQQLQAAVDDATAAAVAAPPAPAAAPAKGAGTPHVPPFTPMPPVVVYTDYPVLARHASASSASASSSGSSGNDDGGDDGPTIRVVTDSAGEALSALWLVTPFKQWRDLPRGLLINQFPYEGALVRKDLLAGTAQRIHAAAAARKKRSQQGAEGGGARAPAGVAAALRASFPPWCPVTFDLATQSHLLAAYHADATAGTAGTARAPQPPPTWIVKLAAGTHSADPCVTDSLPCVLRYAASAPGGDRVAQLYERAPLLLCGGRKVDLRVYVAVKDFAPLDAAVHRGYYGRVAPLPYAAAAGDDGAAAASSSSSPNGGGAEFGRHFTVSWYGDGPQSTLLDTADLVGAAVAEGVDWARDVHPRIVAALGELFAGAGVQAIGHWPASRGLYGVDVLLAWREEQGEAGEGGDGSRCRRVLQPLVLEVNFAGDLQTLLERVPAAAAAAAAASPAATADAAGGATDSPKQGQGHHPFVDEVLTYLFTDAALPPGDHWEALVPPAE